MTDSRHGAARRRHKASRRDDHRDGFDSAVWDLDAPPPPRRRGRAAAALLAAVPLGGLLVAAVLLQLAVPADDAAAKLRGFYDDLGELPDDLGEPARRSEVRAADGSLLAVLREADRVDADLDAMPDHLVDAVLAVEDHEFYAHDGVRPEAIARAAAANWRAGQTVQGGSTITQQLVKNVVVGGEQTLRRKLSEAKLALELERRMGKDEILERYLTQVYLGAGAYGVDAAAERYWGVDVADLTVAQSALLAGLIAEPASDPIDHPARARVLRDRALARMAAVGAIDDDTADELAAAPVEIDPPPRGDRRDPWVVDAALAELADEPALGADRDERLERVHTGGLVVHTTVEPRRQQHARDALAQRVAEPGVDPDAALVDLDADTGALRAVAVAPRDYGDCPDGDEACTDTTVNPALRGLGGSGRQPGSAFKPIVAAAALDAQITRDREIDGDAGRAIDGCVDDGDPWRPTNYSDGAAGTMTLPEAMEVSNNIVFATLAGEIGPEAVAETSARLGVDVPAHCAVALGAADVFPAELAAAYAAFAADGRACAPTVVDRVEGPDGEEIPLDDRCDDDALDHTVARRVADMLRLPVDGDAGTARRVARDDVDLAGKTGTTDRHRDAWFVALTPPAADAEHPGEGARAVAVWMGHTTPAPLTDTAGVSGPVTGGSAPASTVGDYLDRSGVDAGAWPDVPDDHARVADVVGVDEDVAVAALADDGFDVVVEEREGWRPRGEVVDVDPAAGTRLVRRSEVRIAVSDGTQPPPRVPRVLGWDVDAAVAELDARGYDPVVVDRDATDPSRFGRVVDTDPPAWQVADDGAQVQVAVAVDARPRIPDLVGDPVDAARAVLEGWGVDVVERRVDVVDGTRDDVVVAQDPPAGELVADTSRVTVDVAVDARPQVPDLEGLGEGAAEARLSAAGLDAEIVDETVLGARRDGRHDRVARQWPGAGQRVAPDAQVRVVVARDPLVEVPDLVGVDVDDAEARLRDLGLRPVRDPEPGDEDADESDNGDEDGGEGDNGDADGGEGDNGDADGGEGDAAEGDDGAEDGDGDDRAENGDGDADEPEGVVVGHDPPAGEEVASHTEVRLRIERPAGDDEDQGGGAGDGEGG